MKTSPRSSVSMLVAAAMFVLVAATGCCLFMADGHDHGTISVDLCAAMAVVATHVLMVTLALVGPTAARRPWAVTTAAISIPDPPPWR